MAVLFERGFFLVAEEVRVSSGVDESGKVVRLSGVSRDTYSRFMRGLSARCRFLGFSIPYSVPPGSRVYRVVESLRDFVVEEGVAKDWRPHPVSYSRKGRVFRCRCEGNLVERLCEMTQSFSDWQLPDFPEDLFFERRRGSVLFSSVTHEGEGRIYCATSGEKELFDSLF